MHSERLAVVGYVPGAAFDCVQLSLRRPSKDCPSVPSLPREHSARLAQIQLLQPAAWILFSASWVGEDSSRMTNLIGGFGFRATFDSCIVGLTAAGVATASGSAGGAEAASYVRCSRQCAAVSARPAPDW